MEDKDKYYKTKYNTITSQKPDELTEQDENRYSGPILMAMKVDPESNAREESFFQMLKINCCPAFKWLSFTVIITIIDIIVFIIEICLVPEFHGEFLNINAKTIYKMGSSYPYEMKKGHVWLFITPVFLHGNLEHLVSNMIIQVIFGANLEGCIGWIYTLIIYFCTAVSGTLLSALFVDDLGVGASTAIYGLIGAYLGFIFLNWKFLEKVVKIRNQILCIILFIIVFGIVGMFVGGGNVGHLGHTGGFVIGVTLTIGIVPKIKEKYQIEETKRTGLQLFCLIFTILFYVLGFLIFYTLREPKNLNKEIEEEENEFF